MTWLPVALKIIAAKVSGVLSMCQTLGKVLQVFYLISSFEVRCIHPDLEMRKQRLPKEHVQGHKSHRWQGQDLDGSMTGSSQTPKPPLFCVV